MTSVDTSAVSGKEEKKTATESYTFLLKSLHSLPTTGLKLTKGIFSSSTHSALVKVEEQSFPTAGQS